MRITLLIAIIFLNGCSFFGGHDELTLERKPYNGNALRFDGYYYTGDLLDSTDVISMYFLYRNGIILYIMSTNAIKVPELEERIKNESWKSEETRRHHWGIFNVEEKKISYETWIAADGYDPAFLNSGVILSDTTFIIISRKTESKRFDKPKFYNTSITYHFKQFSPKPDSVSKFIE